ncbi:hypothetical protein [Telluribacter humicola]|uniref:hypothetical protein n=1 Tax=Telluribacter humicola TaxID=1720261 RepID=UPI001A97CE6D|nr:hypothetical protein [Telluribacter humicola]
MERETVKIDAEVAERARKQVEKINQKLARRKGLNKPSKVTLNEYLSKAVAHYIELDYDPSREDDKNPLKETINRTTERIITYLQSHEKWYMEPVRQHLEKVDQRLDQNPTFETQPPSDDLRFIRDMSLYSYLTSDLVLNLLFHQHCDTPEKLAELQEWASKRYQERYDELMMKY